MVRIPSITLIALAFVAALAVDGRAESRSFSDRAEEDVRNTRLEMRGSEGSAFRPRAFVFAGPSGAQRVAAPRQFDVREAAGLPASRLPVVGGWFRQPLTPPPDLRGAPVYAVGEEMVIDLRGLNAPDLDVAESAPLQRRVFIVSRTRRTVVTIRPFFRPDDFSDAPAPSFEGEQVGEAFVNGDALVIAPLNRDFVGVRPW